MGWKAQAGQAEGQVSTPAIFEMWGTSSDSISPGISYSLEEAGGVSAPVWRLPLPADPEKAETQLRERQALLESSQAALEGVPERIDRLLEGTRLASSGRIAFDIEAAQALPEPETDLLASLQSLRQPLLGVSFAVDEEQRGKLEAAFERFNADIDRLLRTISHFAWVETEVGEKLIARTIVSWDGDADTAWGTELKPLEYQDHQRSLSQALASRNIILHAILVTVQSAAKLAVLLATPGGALLALPLAWKFVNQILTDVEKFQNLQ
jgi:hypothetical protein